MGLRGAFASDPNHPPYLARQLALFFGCAIRFLANSHHIAGPRSGLPVCHSFWWPLVSPRVELRLVWPGRGRLAGRAGA